MDDNVIQLFGDDNDLFGKVVTHIAEHLAEYSAEHGQTSLELEKVCVTYIAAAARLWAEVEGYPHVQKEFAHLAVELERIFAAKHGK